MTFLDALAGESPKDVATLHDYTTDLVGAVGILGSALAAEIFALRARLEALEGS